MAIDPLAAFTVWEGQALGEERVTEPGFQGEFQAPAVHLHVAGAWAMSSGRRDGKGIVHPAVYVRLLAGVVGTGPRYHLLEGIMDADIARELGETLIACADRSVVDIAAMESQPADGGSDG